jgi:hypothetical protein
MKLALLISLLLLVGCNSIKPVPEREPARAVPAQCDASCFQKCQLQKRVAWQCDPNSPACWDLLYPQVVDPLVRALDLCDDQNRQACVDCLLRLEKARVICNVKEKCSE